LFYISSYCEIKKYRNDVAEKSEVPAEEKKLLIKYFIKIKQMIVELPKYSNDFTGNLLKEMENV
jgi:hypothetical protein